MRFYGCGVNSFFQLGPLMTDGQGRGADDKEDATIPTQGLHPPHHPQERGCALHLPQPLAFDQFLAEEDGPVKDLACGSTFTVALTTRGVPYQWGTLNGTFTRIKRGRYRDAKKMVHTCNVETEREADFSLLTNKYAGRAFPEPTRVSLGVPLRCMQVACGRKHTLALMEGGYVMSWGTYGCLCEKSGQEQEIPVHERRAEGKKREKGSPLIPPVPFLPPSLLPSLFPITPFVCSSARVWITPH